MTDQQEQQPQKRSFVPSHSSAGDAVTFVLGVIVGGGALFLIAHYF